LYLCYKAASFILILIVIRQVIPDMVLITILIMATSLTGICHIATTDTGLTEVSAGVAVIIGEGMGASMVTAVLAWMEDVALAEVDILVVVGKAGEEVVAAAKVVILVADATGAN